MSYSVLDRLLDEDLEADPVTGRGLSNHRPMALIALSSLGADDAHLASFAASYGSRLVPRRAEIAESISELTLAIERDGVVAVLDRVLPQVALGTGGAAFHGLIRLGYGLEHGRASDVAGGLAYLLDVSQPVLRSPRASGGLRDLSGLLIGLGDDPRLRERRFVSSGFSARFAEVAADPHFLEHLARLDGDTVSLASTASAALALYRSTGDFFALHTVTSTHAARLVAQHVSDDSLVRALTEGHAAALAVAYVVIGAPPVTSRPASDAPPWIEIVAATLHSTDEHVLKMVHTCREEQAAWGGLDYQATAAEVCGLVR